MAAKAKQEGLALRRLLGLWTPEDGHPAQPYHRLLSEWRDGYMGQLAATVGGGQIGPGPASILSTAAIQLGASRYLSDLGLQTGDAKLLLDAARLGDNSRQNVLAAFELAAKEAQARPKADPLAWLTSPPPLPAKAPATPKPAPEAKDASEVILEPSSGGGQ